MILRDLLGLIQMCPGEDGSPWAELHDRPAALLRKAVGTSVTLADCGNLAVVVSEQELTFAVTRKGPTLSLGRTFGDRHGVYDHGRIIS